MANHHYAKKVHLYDKLSIFLSHVIPLRQNSLFFLSRIFRTEVPIEPVAPNNIIFLDINKKFVHIKNNKEKKYKDK